MLVIVARWAKYIEIVRSFGKMRCRDRVVGIVTSYGMDGSGFYPRWGKGFSLRQNPSRLAVEPPNFLQWVLGLFPVVKWLGRGVDQAPALPRLKKRVDIPLLPLCAFLACYRGELYFYMEINATIQGQIISHSFQTEYYR
jgi:hypothetical protein